jgi:hypothetical protein
MILYEEYNRFNGCLFIHLVSRLVYIEYKNLKA